MYGVRDPHLQDFAAVLRTLETDARHGLTPSEAARRLAQYGPNALRRPAPTRPLSIFIRQFRGAVVALLAVAAAVALAFGDVPEAIAIFAVIVVNALIGFFTELSAVRSMEALHRLGQVTARVRRAGELVQVDAANLVPGDVVELEGGDIVSADLRLVEASKLSADESALTGESVPVSKHTAALEGERTLAERGNMVYKGTLITRGSGAGVVVGTGLDTELGAITKLVSEATDEQTPLEKRLDALGRNLVWVILVIAGIVSLLGVLRGRDVMQMVQTGIALAVASIPEGLPIVATIALSRGLLRMARRQALVRRLSSVETLGSASVIFSDKTGTLTENRMTVTVLETSAGRAQRNEDGTWTVPDVARGAVDEALRAGVLCNNASVVSHERHAAKFVGDPLEGALLLAAIEHGQDPGECRRACAEVREEPFDSESKRMATFNRLPENGPEVCLVSVKGAPEAVLPLCDTAFGPEGPAPLNDDDRARWLERNAEIAADGMRVIALAAKRVPNHDVKPYEGLTFLALAGMVDPPREDVRASIESCQQAGIRVIMVTGDQAPTARYVARAVGIVSEPGAAVIRGSELRPPDQLSPEQEAAMRAASIFARVSPQQKLDLIALHQKAGEIVAMTGDGVNDAPALKKANIGVAMGQRGTQVAREVADVVLKDDAFHTIVAAIQQGRIIFGNIRKFVIYLLSCNIAEILVIFLATSLNTPLPILPLQILFLNLVTDVFPALALGVGEGDPGVMKRPPRPATEPLLPRRHWYTIVVSGVYISLATLAVVFIAHDVMGAEPAVAVTMSFMTLAGAQLMHVFNMRNWGAGLLDNDVTRNPFVWGAIALCIALLALAVYLPLFQSVLDTRPLSSSQWLVVLGLSLAPIPADYVVRILRKAIRAMPAT
jgi:Ca2+-transporting ATPase